MDKIESFDYNKNINRVLSGLKGGMYFESPVTVPARTIVDGYPSEYAQNVGSTPAPAIPVIDTWAARSAKSK